MYQYRSTKPVTRPAQEESKPELQPKKQLSKQTLRMFQSVFSIIGLIVKQNIHIKVKHSYDKIRKFVTIRKKYSQFLVKKLDYLSKAKKKLYLKQGFNSLLNVKLSYYNEQAKENTKLKEGSKTRAVGAIVTIYQKMDKNKKKNYFDQLRHKSLLNFKVRNFKVTHIFARLVNVKKNKLKEALLKIFSASANNTKKAKVCQKLEIFLLNKKKRNISSCFAFIRLNCYKSKLREVEQQTQKQEQKNVPVAVVEKKVSPLIIANKIQSQKKQLEEKTNKLQRELKDLEATNNKSLNNLKAELTKLQKQNESLKFNNDLLDQNNKELEKQLVHLQKKSRKKLNKNQIWENIYNNLIYFLSANRDKTITKQLLIQCLETPLVPCGISLDELRQENTVLQQLLNQYRNNFPQPQKKSEEPILPYDILRKKNRYYYQVLQVLSEWGTSGTKELDKLNADLASLQKKIGQ